MTDTRTSSVTAVVILAAGAGTRMKSATAKVLHTLAGRSMLHYAVDAANAVQPEHLVVVVGHQREQVIAHLAEIAPHAVTAVQEEQNGTGHAVQVGVAALPSATGTIVVISGDVPLLTGETLTTLVEKHAAEGNAMTLLTSQPTDPTGYGRIVRDGDQCARIVEQRDASPAELLIGEINAGTYVFDGATLGAGLGELRTDNAQREVYLTDMVAWTRARGGRVVPWLLGDAWQAEGVNDRVQLAAVGRELNTRLVEKWQRAGVTVVDPHTTWIHHDVDLAQDVTILPNTHLEGATSVESGAVIGPDTTLSDVEVGAGATVSRTQASLSVIGPKASVGPFAYLRPGTVLGENGKIGTFVETKNAKIAPEAKVPHLTYCGDAVIGEGVNIGAGTIFANYDGEHKHTSTVGNWSFVGSNTVLVAPVHIGDGVYVAAGSTVTSDVGPGELAVARGLQRNIPGWVARKKAGSKTAAAAEAAQAAMQQEGAE